MPARRRTRTSTSPSSTPADAGPRGARDDTQAVPTYGGSFRGRLFKWAGTGAWHFVEVPEDLSPPVTHAWGRTPVTATVDGDSWATSVWRGKDGRTLLAIPKAIRGRKQDGDLVDVTVSFHVL